MGKKKHKAEKLAFDAEIEGAAVVVDIVTSGKRAKTIIPLTPPELEAILVAFDALSKGEGA